MVIVPWERRRGEGGEDEIKKKKKGGRKQGSWLERIPPSMYGYVYVHEKHLNLG